jgi:hypothetical protein
LKSTLLFLVYASVVDFPRQSNLKPAFLRWFPPPCLSAPPSMSGVIRLFAEVACGKLHMAGSAYVFDYTWGYSGDIMGI